MLIFFLVVSIVRRFCVHLESKQTFKDGLLRHHSACCSSPPAPGSEHSQQGVPATSQIPCWKTRTSPGPNRCALARPFVFLQMLPTPTQRINESQWFLAFVIMCLVFGRWSVACRTLCRTKCAVRLRRHCFSLCSSSWLPDSVLETWLLTVLTNWMFYLFMYFRKFSFYLKDLDGYPRFYIKIKYSKIVFHRLVWHEHKLKLQTNLQIVLIDFSVRVQSRLFPLPFRPSLPTVHQVSCVPFHFWCIALAD